MKITEIIPWLIEAPAPYLDTADDEQGAIPLREYLFVEVRTDGGVTGWGEITAKGLRARVLCAAIRHVSDFLAGTDPRFIERTWNRIFREFTYMGSRGATTNIISAIDIALWDIRGKVLGMPISELFGGPVRDGIPIYCHPRNGSTPEVTAQHDRALAGTGQKSLKIDPWQPKHEEEADGYLSGKVSAEAENHGVAVIAVIREAVGPDFEILVDCHGRFDAPTAIRLAKALEPYKLFWFEEPVPVESTHALRQVRQNVSVPNHYRVETHRAKLSAYDVFIDHPLDIKGDKIFLSDRPGLGIELDRDYMRGHAFEGHTG